VYLYPYVLCTSINNTIQKAIKSVIVFFKCKIDFVQQLEPKVSDTKCVAKESWMLKSVTVFKCKINLVQTETSVVNSSLPVVVA